MRTPLHFAPLERALDAYHAEYHRLWRDGGDAGDHDEAHESALAAVLALAARHYDPITGRRREENA